MSGEPLLTDLCKICTNHPPKYTCPRCSSRTCSLPCYKRHKLWSQCSGRRSPSAYVKRSALATPASIDRDYNFLTGIERAFERADKDADRRGIRIYGDAGPDAIREGRNLDSYLKENGIRVERGPRGMSRQRSNATRWSAKQKCVIWTVEWVREDGGRVVRECAAERAVGEAFGDVRPRAANAVQRKSNKRRKVRAGDQEEPQTQNGGSLDHDNAAATAAELQRADGLKEDGGQAEPNTAEGMATTINFYLLRPHTLPPNQRVLVPLTPDASLTSCLRNRTVLEYPTIYTLPHTPSALPEGFITESEYVRSGVTEVDEIEGMLKEFDGEEGEAEMGEGEVAVEGDGKKGGEGERSERPFDERMIAEMLARDVGAQ